MSKILVLGGTGYTGRLIAQHLLEHSNASITIATRHLDKAQAFADKLNQEYPGTRAKATYADASPISEG
jgi:saccharopine dehydrogenase (NAD+, L-lysine-forming)